MRLLAFADLLLPLIALPIFIAADFPMLGWAAGTVAWYAQRAVQVLTTRKATASDDPRKLVGILAGSMIGRGWLVAITIFAVGLVENDAGLSAAVLAIACFTLYFTLQMILRPFETTPKGGTTS